MIQASPVQWVAALATSLAVIVALFKEVFWRWWQRPRLMASIVLGPPDCHLTPAGEFRSNRLYFFRLWVQNKGRGSAEQVQMFASRLLRRESDGEFRVRAEFLPMYLRWTHTNELYMPRIDAEMGRHCDLGFIGKNYPERFQLALETVPHTDWHLLEPGAYRLDLRLAAANARPEAVTLEMSFDGRWRDEQAAMFREGIGIRLLPRREGSRMNWRRGLTRLYVAMWLALALVPGVHAGIESRQALSRLRDALTAIDRTKRERTSPIGATDLGRLAKRRHHEYDGLADEEVGRRLQHEHPSPHDQLAAILDRGELPPDSVRAWFWRNEEPPSKVVVTARGSDSSAARMVGPYGTLYVFPAAATDDEMRAFLRRDERSRTSRRITVLVGSWLAWWVVLPGGLLIGIRWVWAGFRGTSTAAGPSSPAP